MNYVRDLPEGELPDCRRLRNIFRSLFQRSQSEYDQVYDWTILEYMAQKCGEGANGSLSLDYHVSVSVVCMYL